MFVEYQEIDDELLPMFFVGHEVEDEAAGLISSVWQSHTDEVCKEQRLLHWQQLVRGGILNPSLVEDEEA